MADTPCLLLRFPHILHIRLKVLDLLLHKSISGFLFHVVDVAYAHQVHCNERECNKDIEKDQSNVFLI